MSMIMDAAGHYLSLLAPPLLGALIGYLANTVIIRMLFRPRRPWRILGMTLPMTPGLILAKRQDLAGYFSEMAGERLLTTEKIEKAVYTDTFQGHLMGVIKERVDAVLHRDLGTLLSLIPEKFTSYFDIAVKTVTYQVKDGLHKYVGSDDCLKKLEKSIDSASGRFLQKDLQSLIPEDERRICYGSFETRLALAFEDPGMAQWVEGIITQKVHAALTQGTSLQDVLPFSSHQLIVKAIDDQIPALLGRIAQSMQEPAVTEALARFVCKCLHSAIDSHATLAALNRGLMRLDIEKMIADYLGKNQEVITEWLRNEEVRSRVQGMLSDYCLLLLQTPVINLLQPEQQKNITALCDVVSRHVLNFLKEKATAKALSSTLGSSIETHIQGGSVPLGDVLHTLFGEKSQDRLRTWLKGEGAVLMRSKETVATIDAILDTLIGGLLSKPVGRLSHLLPAGIRDGICLAIQNMASAMLAAEVPRLLQAVNIKSLLADRVNSLDPLVLERHLRSTLAKPFKAFQVAGAVLGLLIGFLHLFF